ncbi:hypothetical protein BDQ17DRAFT_1351103 [Cyathus striatus]|nr:hypothetical protein BDQ17DRAFT_1351103 [Cyathus striatus]
MYRYIRTPQYTTDLTRTSLLALYTKFLPSHSSLRTPLPPTMTHPTVPFTPTI